MDYTVALFLVFRGNSIVFSTVATPTYIPSNNVGGFLFLHILASVWFFLCVFFLIITILTGVR